MCSLSPVDSNSSLFCLFLLHKQNELVSRSAVRPEFDCLPQCSAGPFYCLYQNGESSWPTGLAHHPACSYYRQRPSDSEQILASMTSSHCFTVLYVTEYGLEYVLLHFKSEQLYHLSDGKTDAHRQRLHCFGEKGKVKETFLLHRLHAQPQPGAKMCLTVDCSFVFYNWI